MIKLIAIVGAAIVIAIAIISGINTLLNVDDLKNCAKPVHGNSTCAPADVIIAISGGDTTARTDEAIRLYKDGWAPKLLFSGAALDSESPSNASVMRQRALERVVPAEDIIVEPLAMDTIQNAIRSQSLLGDVKRIILVTSPYHQRRAAVEFQKMFGDKVTIVSHPTPDDKFWPDNWWMFASCWWMALTETVKTAIAVVYV